MSHGSVRQQEAILQDGQDASPGTSVADGMHSCDLRAVWLLRGGPPCRLHDMAPSSAENDVACRACSGELGTILRAGRSLGRTTQRGGAQKPQIHNAPVMPRGAGGQTQPKLERAADRSVAGREGVVDGQGDDPEGGDAGGAAQQMGFVPLCALERTASCLERGEGSQAGCGGGA